VAIAIIYRMLIFDCKIVRADRWPAQKIRSIILMMLNAQTHAYENIKWIWTHPVCLRQTPLYEREISPCQ